MQFFPSMQIMKQLDKLEFNEVRVMDIRTATSSDLEKIAELYVKNHTETYRDLLSDDYFESLTLDYAKEKWRT